MRTMSKCLMINKLFSRQEDSLKLITKRKVSLSAINFGILKSSSSDVVLPEISVPEFIFSRTEQFYKYTAVECSSTGKKYTFEEVRKKSINFGKALRHKLKLQQTDVIAILLPNCPEYVISTLGIMCAGMVVTSLNPLYTAEELSKQLLDSNVKLAITKTFLYNNAKKALALAKLPAPVVTIKEKENENLPPGAINFEELLNETTDIKDIAAIKSSDLAFLPYSSGTTGLPKGVQLTHYNLVSNLCQMMHPDFEQFIPPSDYHQDVFPLLLPMFHIYGFTCGILQQLSNGVKILSVTKFESDSFISLLKNHPVTHLYVTPSVVLLMTTNPKVTQEHVKSLRLLISGAAPLRYSDEVRFVEKMKKSDMTLGQAYGMTETSPLVSWSPRNYRISRKNGGSVGKVVPNTYIKIVAVEDSDSGVDTVLGPNEVGELLIKGPQNSPGYYNRPEENARLLKGEWLRTGDLAYYNEEGYLFVTDRLKELIKVKGFQVAPAELEGILRSIPSVEDAAVIGIPHDRHGEVPRAYVVVKKGHSLKSEEIQQFLEKKVVSYKHLTGGVQFVEVIPKTQSGKILRRELKQEYQVKGV